MIFIAPSLRKVISVNEEVVKSLLKVRKLFLIDTWQMKL